MWGSTFLAVGGESWPLRGSSARETGLAGRSLGTCSFGLYGRAFQEERTGLMVAEILHGIKKGSCEASMESGIAAALAQGGPETWTRVL